MPAIRIFKDLLAVANDHGADEIVVKFDRSDYRVEYRRDGRLVGDVARLTQGQAMNLVHGLQRIMIDESDTMDDASGKVTIDATTFEVHMHVDLPYYIQIAVPL